ncbi:MAG TPA: sulfurtransferase [Phototrophicaceae bacterium]|nr:sulfurtransferase [Phototrophicaceae bacterium]
MSENLLVSTEWLNEHLNDAPVRIVDIRGHVLPASEPLPHYYNHEADYTKSHIPGAVFVDWVKEITDPADPRHAQIAQPERYAAVMERIGVGDDTLVIAYDDAKGMFAARLWWSLNYYGHTNVAVLDGGWDKWIAEGRPTTAEIPAVTPSHFTPNPDANVFRSGAQVLAHMNGDQHLIDVRTPEEFAGKASRARRGGHIPGAFNLPRALLVAPDGTMLNQAALKRRFASAGISENSPDVVFYCNGGVSASFGLLALRAAGFEGGSVYDGSWKDWGNDDQKPIATE